MLYVFVDKRNDFEKLIIEVSKVSEVMNFPHCYLSIHANFPPSAFLPGQCVRKLFALL